MISQKTKNMISQKTHTHKIIKSSATRPPLSCHRPESCRCGDWSCPPSEWCA